MIDGMKSLLFDRIWNPIVRLPACYDVRAYFRKVRTNGPGNR